MSKVEIETTDRRILEALQADGRLTIVELADRVGLSPSPCLRRVRHLERDGYIEGYRAALNRSRIGLGLTVFVGIKLDGHADERAAGLQTAIRDMPEVVSCYIVSGEADYLLEVVVPDLAHYEQFLMGSLLKNPLIKDVRSSFAIRMVKASAPLSLGHLP